MKPADRGIPIQEEDITPCAACGEKHQSLLIHVIETTMAVVNTKDLQARIGLGIMLGSDKLAKVMGGYDSIVELAPESSGLRRRLLICPTCYRQPLNIAELVEKENERLEKKKEAMEASG